MKSAVPLRRKAISRQLLRSFLVCLSLVGVKRVAEGGTSAVVAGYYTAWNRSVLPPSGLQLAGLTHIIHAFAVPNPDGTIAVQPNLPDSELIASVHLAHKKVLLSLGGEGGNAGFDTIALDPSRRSVFAANVVKLLKSAGYDGVDIDWEDPLPFTPARRDSLVSLVRELRGALDVADTSLILTMAVPVTPYYGSGFRFGSLVPYVRWFNAMTYDYHGTWSTHASHLAPLYASAGDTADFSVHQSVNYLLGQGIPASKLVIGIPFYGIEFTAAGLLAPSTGGGPLPYSSVAPLVNAPGWSYRLDSVSCVPYLTNGVSFVSFDDSSSCVAKYRYARSRNLLGVMIWELSQGILPGGRQPLLSAIAAEELRATAVALPGERGGLSSAVTIAAYPNPFNPATTVRVAVPAPMNVVFSIYDLLGRKIAEVASGWLEAGTTILQVNADAYGLSSGVYIGRLQTPAGTVSIRLVLAK